MPLLRSRDKMETTFLNYLEKRDIVKRVTFSLITGTVPFIQEMAHEWSAFSKNPAINATFGCSKSLGLFNI